MVRKILKSVLKVMIHEFNGVKIGFLMINFDYTKIEFGKT